jgi:ketosteroid isomerase-like protein
MLDFPTPPVRANSDRRRYIEFLVSEFLNACVRGGAAAIAKRLASDFVHRARGVWPMWPHGGPIGRAQFVEAAGIIIAEFEFLEAKTHEFLIDGNAAAVHVTSVIRNRGLGGSVEVDFWIFLRVRNALIVEAAIYVDAAKAAMLLPAGLVDVRCVGPPQSEGRTEAGSRARRAVVTGDREKIGVRDEADGVTADARHQACVERTVRDLTALRSRGDLPAILDRLAPDFVYSPLGDWTRAALQPGRCDRATFAEALRLMIIEFEDLGSELHELVVDGDRVAVHRTFRVRNRGSGAITHVDEWEHCRIRAGLIVEMACYIDATGATGLDWPAYGLPR